MALLGCRPKHQQCVSTSPHCVKVYFSLILIGEVPCEVVCSKYVCTTKHFCCNLLCFCVCVRVEYCVWCMCMPFVYTVNWFLKVMSSFFKLCISNIFQESSFLLFVSGLHGGRSLGIKRPRERKACPVVLQGGKTDRCEVERERAQQRSVRLAAARCWHASKSRKLFFSVLSSKA